MSDPLAYQVVVDALARCDTLREEAFGVQREQFRSAAPLALARLLERLGEIVAGAIRDEWSQHVETGSDAALRKIYTWDSLVRQSANHLRYLRGSTADRTPGTLGRALDYLAENLGVEMQILLREKWRYNYSVQVEALSEHYRASLEGDFTPERIEEVFSDLGKPLHAIAFPAIERQNILLHAAFGHELGHLVVDRWLRGHDNDDQEVGKSIREKAESLKKEQDVLAAARQTRSGEASRRKKRSGEESDGPLLAMEEMASLVQRIADARKRLLEEYAADLVGIELFGPSAYLAMISIASSQPGKMDQAPTERENYYPPWKTRLKQGYEQLETAGWYPFNEVPTELAKHIEETSSRIRRAEELSKTPVSTTDWKPYIRVANELAIDRLPAFRQYLVDEVLDDYPKRDRLLSHSWTLTGRIERKLPPNDCGDDQLKPVRPELSAILNAGWFYRLGWLDVGRTLDSRYYEELQGLQRLVLKAIEDSVLMADYKDWKQP